MGSGHRAALPTFSLPFCRTGLQCTPSWLMETANSFTNIWVKRALAPWVMIAVTFLVTSKSTCSHSLGLLLWGRTDSLQPSSSNEKDTIIAAEAKLALHFPLLHLPYQASSWSHWVLNQCGSECAACTVHVVAHTSHTALTRRPCWDPSCLPGVSLHRLPLASRHWSCPEGSGGPGLVSIWRRRWRCGRTRRCAHQESPCSPFLRAWSSLEERSNACQGLEQTHHGDAFCLLTAPTALHAFALITCSSLPCCRCHGPCTAWGPCLQHDSGKTTPTFFSPWRFYLRGM